MTNNTSSTTQGSVEIYNGNDSWIITGEAGLDIKSGSIKVKSDKGISPQLYFKYIKKNFNILEKFKLDRRLQKLEKSFNQACSNGQDMLSNKILNMLSKEFKESQIYAKGIKLFINKETLNKHKRNIKGGHISDTRFKDYTRIIPKDTLNKKKKVDNLFDDFIIYHYYNKEVETKLEKNQEMSKEEIDKMKDPVLFGTINETDRLYFIDDWEDEYCDLTFDEILDVLSDEECVLTNKITKI